jgi:homoserine kinase
MSGKSVLIRVPATIGSFAGAANCAALALDASFNVKVTTRFDGRVSIRYFGEDGERVPRDRSNLVVQALESALHSKRLEFAGGDFEIYSSVPVAVGLGSSTAAVLAGLIAGDQLFHLQLTEKQILDLASVYESRIDALRTAWLGGFVALAEDGSFSRTLVPEQFVLSVIVPEHGVVPGAVRGEESDPSSRPERSAVLLQATELAEWIGTGGTGKSLRLGTLPIAGCEKYVPGLEEALAVRTPDLAGVFVCGSGPAVGILEENPSDAVKLVLDCFARNDIDSRCLTFHSTNTGAREWNPVRAEISLTRAAVLSPPAKKISLIPV